MRILVVEDEPRMAAILQQGLSEESHIVTIVGNGREALSLIRRCPFDLVILDVMLPGLDGLNVAQRMRAADIRTPILMLTARDRTKDVVAGLDAGADDYLTKPFPFEELCARVRALARRNPIPRTVCLQVADLRLDPATREVHRGARSIELTRTEFAILELLLRNAGRVVARQSLLDGVWGPGADVESNTLDAFIRLLRSKVDLPIESPLIHTLRGVGYVIREEN